VAGHLSRTVLVTDDAGLPCCDASPPDRRLAAFARGTGLPMGGGCAGDRSRICPGDIMGTSRGRADPFQQTVARALCYSPLLKLSLITPARSVSSFPASPT
jgi:hypothetical protein